MKLADTGWAAVSWLLPSPNGPIKAPFECRWLLRSYVNGLVSPKLPKIALDLQLSGGERAPTVCLVTAKSQDVDVICITVTSPALICL